MSALPLAAGLPDAINPVNLIGDGAGAAANTVLGVIADAIGKAVEVATAGIGTAWIRIDTPQLASDDGQPSAVVAFLQGDLRWIVMAIAIVSILVAAGRAAWDGRAEPLRDLARGIVTLVIVTGAGVATVALMVAASDMFSQWVVEGSLQDGDFGKTVASMLALSGMDAPMVLIVLGFIAFIASLLQMALLVFRAGVLVVLCGVMPLAFAAAGTETGRDWSRRYATWLLAFVLYKPAAALIYAASFRLVAAGAFSASGILKATVGVALMVAAILALPGLMRVLAPAVAAVNLRGGGGGGGGAMVAAAAMPTGARMLAGGGATLAAMGASAMPSGAVNTPAAAPPPSGGNGAGPAAPPTTPGDNPSASSGTQEG